KVAVPSPWSVSSNHAGAPAAIVMVGTGCPVTSTVWVPGSPTVNTTVSPLTNWGGSARTVSVYTHGPALAASSTAFPDTVYSPGSTSAGTVTSPVSLTDTYGDAFVTVNVTFPSASAMAS